MQKWEYAILLRCYEENVLSPIKSFYLNGEKLVEFNIEEEGKEVAAYIKALNIAGSRGWELVTVEDRVILKRPIS